MILDATEICALPYNPPCETLDWPNRGTAAGGGRSLLRDAIMAHTGTGFFDRKGNFFKTARDATVADLAALLGKIGDGESLAPGIANMLLERRAEIEQLFAEHDRMLEEEAVMKELRLAAAPDNVAKLPSRPAH